MSYYGEVAQNMPAMQAAQTSVLSDSARVCDQLHEIYGRLIKLGDALHGAELKNVAKPPDPPASMPTVRRNIDDALATADRIFNELTRIESRL